MSTLCSPPDYDAPSPSADDHMELELPDEQGDSRIELNQPASSLSSSAAVAASARPEDIPRPPTPNGDLNSRLDSMMGSNAIQGLSSDPRDVDLRAPAATASRPAKQPSAQSSSNYSISEFLTKLASGEDVDVEEFTKGSSRVTPASAPNRQTSSGGGDGGFWGGHEQQQQQQQPSGFAWNRSSSSSSPSRSSAAAAHAQEDWPPPHKEWPEPRPDPAASSSGAFLHTGWDGQAGGTAQQVQY